MIGVVLGLAALRMVLYNAAFPAFNNVDEASHFDLVLYYSQGRWPEKALQPLLPQTAEHCVLYGSPEYLRPPQIYPNGQYPPPPATYPAVRSDPMFPYMVRQAEQFSNYEAGSFPTYYAGAGLWAAIGRACGLQGDDLFYWIRFLNVPMFVLLVWLCYRIAGLLVPGSRYFQIGLPAAAALFPQDLFYTINSDAFSAVFFALALYLFLQMDQNPPSMVRSLITGLVVAATFLVKPSNLAVAVLLILFVVSQAMSLYPRKPGTSKALLSLAVLCCSAAVPVGLWMLRCHAVFGDWTGASAKIAHLGWTLKPWADRFDHPIFTLSGMEFFLAELTRTFWRGELFWQGRRIASSGMDSLYIGVTLVVLAVAMVRSLWPEKQPFAISRRILGLCWILLAVSVCFLAWVSIRFDYGHCHYPSREEPYFTSGRLIVCIFVPFLLLFLQGFRSIWFGLKNTGIPLIALIVLFLGMTIQEALLNAPAFHSTYNWFHLP